MEIDLHRGGRDKNSAKEWRIVTMFNLKCQTITLIFLSLIVNSGVVFAQAKKDTRNVVDYYNLYVSSMIEEPDSTEKITIRDTKNGFLEILGDVTRREAALFRKDNGGALLLVAEYDCSSICYTELDAYEPYQDGTEMKMAPATLEVLPRLSRRENLEIFNKKRAKNQRAAVDVLVQQNLPRKGRIIQVLGTDLGNKFVKLYELHLKNDKFVIVRN